MEQKTYINNIKKVFKYISFEQFNHIPNPWRLNVKISVISVSFHTRITVTGSVS